MVSAVFPTPPSPSTTSLYRVIFPAMMARLLWIRSQRWEARMNPRSSYVVVDRNAAPSQVKRRILYSIAIVETGPGVGGETVKLA